MEESELTSQLMTSQLGETAMVTEKLTSIFKKLKQKHSDLTAGSLEEFYKVNERATQLRQDVNDIEVEAGRYADFSSVQRSALDAITEDIKHLALSGEEKKAKVKEHRDENTFLPNEKTNAKYKENIETRRTEVNDKIANIRESIRPYEEYLGLCVHNETGEEGDTYLRFIFTCIDELDVDAEFSFSLKVEEEVYCVFDVSPPVPELDMLLKDLNYSGNLKMFFCGIRKAFQRTCATTTTTTTTTATAEMVTATAETTTIETIETTAATEIAV